MFTTDTEKIRMCFRTLKKLSKKIREEGIQDVEMNELSMGMSSDYKIAIEEGATIIRVGQNIFGPRSTPDSYYWPESRR